MTSELAVGPLSRGSTRVLSRFAAPERRRTFWVALWVAAAAAEFGALAPVLFQHVPVQPIDVVFRLVGGSFVACGLIAWHRRPDNHSGLLMTATGFAFFVSPLLTQIDSPLPQTLALVFPDLWLLFFVPLLLTFLTAGRLRSRVDRILVAAVLFEVLVLAPLFLMFSDADGATLLLVRPDPQIAAIVDTAQRSWFLAVTVATAAVLAARWRAASAPGRRAMLPSVAGAGCLLLFTLLLAVDLVVGPPRSQVLLWITACSLVTVPLAFLTGLLRSRLARGGLADLFRELRTMQPGELQAALARVLHDPGFAILYPGPDGTVVDAEGRPATLPGRGDARSVTPVERDGEQVATLVYDTSLDDDPELVDAVGGAATIALENRQLQVEAQVRLAELQASRERIITAGDAERRRIERNLHDGAQQRLVTLALQLSLIQRRIRQDPGDAEQLVTSASDELARSLEELRELARGIHPAALDQGLAPALDALAMRSAVPTTVACDVGSRLPEAVEFAAYFVASEALTNVAKYAQASTATVRVTRTPATLVVEIRDDGIGGADPTAGTGLLGLADRVAALGGHFQVSSPPAGGTVVTAEMPLPPADPINAAPTPESGERPGRTG